MVCPIGNLTEIYNLISADEIFNDEVAQKAFIEEVEYKGFDAAVLVGILVAKFGPLNANTRALFMKDMVSCCTIATTRGSDPDAIIRNSSATAAASISALKTKYGIVKMSAASKSPRTVTFPRIAACFPTIVSMMIYLKRLTAKCSFDDLEPWLCHPGGGTMILSTDAVRKAKWLDWNFEFSCLINKKTNRTDSDKYGAIVLKSGTNTLRTRMWNEMQTFMRDHVVP